MIVTRRQNTGAGLSAACTLMLLAGTAVAAQPAGQPASAPAGAASSGAATHTRSGSSTGTATPASGGTRTATPLPEVTVETDPLPTGTSPAGQAGTTPLPTAPSQPQAEQDELKPEDVDPYPNDPASHGSGEQGAAPAGEAGENPPSNGVKVSEFMTVDIFVQDEDLANVLQMLSLQSRRNIVASKDVNARVTANLYGVTFFEALDSILHVNGYGYVERGNFIYVYTLDEIKQIQAEERRLVSRVIKLNYLNANDAAEFVTPLLSDKGQIKTNGDVGNFNLPADTPAGNEEFALSATLVLFDYEENLTEIEALLKQLDTRPAQVLVEATILQTTLTEANAFGVDFALLNGVDFTDFFGFGGPLGVANSLLKGVVAPVDNEGGGLVSSPGNTAGPSTLKLSIINDDLAVFIRALDEVSDVTILSNPKILALNRQPARVLVGRKIGYLNTTSTETATTQTVEFLDTGTSLSFRPFIAKDNMVRLELKPRVSEGVIRDSKDATGAAVTIPDEITQEITTNVIVPDGSTVVLGGLFKESTTLSRTQVPLVGDIPIIGAAFRGHEDHTDRNEIIFMIKPTVMNEKVLVEEGDRANDYAERVRTGTRQGLLPWARDRQTTQLNVEAERLAAAGEKDKALWSLRRSLELNPDQPEALRLQEELTGERHWWPNRSGLREIVGSNPAVSSAPASSTEDAANATAEASADPSADPAIDGQNGAVAEPSADSGVSPAEPSAPVADGGSENAAFESMFEGASPETSPAMEPQSQEMPSEMTEPQAPSMPETPAGEPGTNLMPQAVFMDFQNPPESFNAGEQAGFQDQSFEAVEADEQFADPMTLNPSASSFGPIMPGYPFAMYWSAMRWRAMQAQTGGAPTGQAAVSSVTTQPSNQIDQD